MTMMVMHPNPPAPMLTGDASLRANWFFLPSRPKALATVLASGSHDSLLVVWNLVGLWRTREVQYQKFGETDHPSGIVQVGP